MKMQGVSSGLLTTRRPTSVKIHSRNKELERFWKRENFFYVSWRKVLHQLLKRDPFQFSRSHNWTKETCKFLVFAKDCNISIQKEVPKERVQRKRCLNIRKEFKIFSEFYKEYKLIGKTH